MSKNNNNGNKTKGNQSPKAQKNNSIIESIFDFIKIVFLRLKQPKNITFQNISIFFTIIALICYMLSYVFFYGYYFGGNDNSIISLLDVIINPVPFNFKSLSVLGLIMILIFFTLVHSAIQQSRILKNDCESKVKLLIDFLFLVFMIIVIHFCLMLFFKGDIEDISTIEIWNTPLLIVTATIFIVSRKLYEFFLGVLNGTFWTIIIGVSCKLIKFPFNEGLIYFATTLIFQYMFIFIKNNKIKKFTIIVGISAPVLSEVSKIFTNLITKKEYLIIKFIKIINHNNYIFLATLIIASLIVSAVVYTILQKVFRKLIKENNLEIKIKDITNNIIQGFVNRNKLVLFLMIVLIYTLIPLWFCFNLGKDVQRPLSLSRLDEISYYTGNSNKPIESITGNIVSYKDGIYYISDKHKHLITIRSNMVYTKSSTFINYDK